MMLPSNDADARYDPGERASERTSERTNERANERVARVSERVGRVGRGARVQYPPFFGDENDTL